MKHHNIFAVENKQKLWEDIIELLSFPINMIILFIFHLFMLYKAGRPALKACGQTVPTARRLRRLLMRLTNI